MSGILVRYGEVALKGKNRGQFEQQLLRNLKAAVKDYSAKVTRLHGRFKVNVDSAHLGPVTERLRRVFGVVSISPVHETALDLEAIDGQALDIAGALSPGPKTFRIEARRANKQFPLTSPEISRHLGARLQEAFPELAVDLDNPSFTLSVEIGYDRAYLYLERLAGPGGLPVGVSGRSLLLLSGGIDSPTAGWLAMKRGLALEGLHFHSFPLTGKRSQEKAVDLCRRLSLYCGMIPLHMLSVNAIQKALQANCPPELSITLLRRMMLRLAERLARERGLQALITGESLGQVASQTLESLEVISRATEMLILRPLIGMDKCDIIELAVKIDTYDISIRPYEDCCTLFVPKNPATRPRLKIVEKFEAGLPVEDLLDEAMATLETMAIRA